MTVVLDAGALVAVERRSFEVIELLKRSKRRRVPVVTSAAVVGQVWRDGARQVNLARTMGGVVVKALDEVTGQRLGELLAASRTADVIDAHVALLVRDFDLILTSDPDDIRRLLDTRGVRAVVRRV